MDITGDVSSSQPPQPIVSLETDSLDAQPATINPILTGSLAPSSSSTTSPKTTYSTRWAVLLSGFVLTLLILTGLAGLAIAHFSHQPTTTASKSATVALDNYDVMNIPLQSLAKAGQLQLGPTSQLLVNGQLRLNNDLVLLPTSQPTKPTAGQFYFSQTTDQPYYYNGSQYVSLLGSGQAVTSIGGLQGTVTLGSGLQVANGQLTATPSATTTPTTPQQVVTSLQGQTGTVNLLAGTGINLNGTTISNDGVTSLGGSTGAISLGAGLQVTNHTLASTTSITAGSSNLNVTSDGNGHFTISETGVGASGVVALGPASAQTDSSTNPAISINKTSTGDLLDVTVNGTSQFVVTSTGQITSGSIDYDQVIGAPLTTVTSLGGSSAAISLGQGLTMAGSILSNSGVTSLTGTANQVMVSTSSGDVTLSLPQNLAVSSSPSFASLSITGMATAHNFIQNGNAVCDASGNCVGTGTAGSAIGGNGTANTLAMFTAAGTIGNSILSQNSAGTTMTVGGSLTATSLTGNGAGVTNVNASELAGNTSSYYTSASNIDSGILGDAYLQGDVALYDATTANFTGTNLEHNGNQVCDTSNNCGYLTGSAANGQYIELQTGTPTAQTGNLAVTGSGTAGSLAATTITQDGNTVCDTSGNCSGVYGGSGPTGVTSLNSQAGALNLLGTSGQVTVTTSGTNLTVALANTAVTVGSYGTASSVAQFSVNASGQLTAASATPIAIAGSQVTSGTISNARLNSDVATYDNTTSNFTGTNLQHNGNAVCDASGNCVGTGTAGSAIGGNGTANTLAMFTAAGTIGNSILSQNSAGTTMTVGGSLTATSLTGNGAGVTNVNASELAGNTSSYYTSASNIDSGILGDAYLQGDVALYDATTANFTGTNLEHNGNQVCDTSNNCGYLTGSAANGQYIELQTGTPTAQTGNLAVTGSGTAGSLAATTITQDGNTVCDTSGNCSGVYGGSGPTGVTSLNSQAGALNLLGTSGQVTVTTSGTNLTVALANTAVTVGSYGTAGSIAQFSVNASGQLTAASTTPIAIAGSQVTSGTISNARLNSDVATYDNTTSNFTGTNLQHNGNAVCDASGNCVGTGTAGSAIGGNGTANTLAMFTAAGTIGNSILSQNSAGTTMTVGGSLTATSLTGNGAGVTNVNASELAGNTSSYYTSASNIDSGILGDAYLQGDVALYDATTANFTGTNLEHNGNQVCDTSNNCGYLTGSAANGQYIELQTGTPTAQTGNLAVTGSGTAGSLAATTITQDGNTVCDTSGNCSGVYGGSGPTGVTSLNSQAGALNLLGTSGQVTVTTSGTNLTVALANTAVTVGSYGTASSVAQFSVNASGQLTAASATPIAIAGSQVTSGTISNARLNSDVATYDNTTSNFTGTNLEHNGNAVCDASGNCVGTGTAGSAIGGNGTTNTLAVFTAAGTIGNSILTQNSAATTLTVAGTLAATDLQGDGSAVTNVNATELGGNTSSYFTNASNIVSGILGDRYLEGDVALYDATTANFTGTLEQAGNQVCDASNNCGYLTGSAANGDYVALQSATPVAQTGNLAVTGSSTAGSLAATTITQDGNTVCDTSGNCSGVYGGSGPSGVTSLNSQAGALSLLGTSGQVTVTTSGTTLTVALANTAVTVGSYGSASSVAQFSVNASGQLTSASSTPIAIAGSQVTSGTISNARLNSDVATYDNTTSNFTGTNLEHNGNAVCDASGNCVGTGTAGSAIGGNGTTNTLAVFTAAGTIGNSILTQNSAATTLTVAGTLAATDLQGDGAGLTSLNASSVSSGTLATNYGGTGLDGSTAAYGQLLIGTGSGYTLATLTPGSGIAIANASGSITVGVNSTVCTTAGNCSVGSGIGGGEAFLQGGNSFGTTAVLGTNDNNPLNIETDGTTRLSITAAGTVTIGSTATGGVFINDGSTLDTALALGNFTTNNSAIGTAAATVNVYTTFTINQTTTGITLTLPNPTTTTAGRIIYVANIGTAAFTISGDVISPGTNASFLWNGSVWTATAVSTGVTLVGALDGGTANSTGATISGNTIYLQSASATNPGLVNTTTQSFGGNKTFTGNTAIQTTSTTAFQVAGGSTLLNADTSNMVVSVGGAELSYVSGSGSLTGFAADSGSPFAVGSSPDSVTTATINGQTAIITANASSRNVSVLLGNGTGGFTPDSGSPFAVGNGPESVTTATINGQTAIITANYGDNTVSVLLGNGTGGFTPDSGSPFAVGNGPYSVTTATINGQTAIITANLDDNTVSVLLGNGTGGFTADSGSPFAVGSEPDSVTTATINGQTAIITANAGDNTVSVLLGNGTGGFTADSGSPFAVGSEPDSVTTATINGQTAIITANAGDNTVSVLLGNGTGGFTADSGSPFAVGSEPAVTTATINGQTAIITANYGDNTVSVLLGNGTGGFTPDSGSPFADSNGPASVTTATINGQTAIITANFNSNNVSVLLGTYGPPTTASGTLSLTPTSAAQAGLIIQGASGQTADLLHVQNASGSDLFSIAANGQALFSNAINSTTAFQVQNASGTTVLGVDTADGYVNVTGEAFFQNDTTVTYNNSATANPLQAANPPAPINEYNEASSGGYQFTPTVNGNITALGSNESCNSNAASYTVKLYNSSGTVLATASTASGEGWAYTSITPVAVTAGTTYTVAVYSGGSHYLCYGSFNSYPINSGNITISESLYGSGNSLPTNVGGGDLWGYADITLQTGGSYNGPGPSAVFNGPVGIDNSSPQYPLDVAGDINLTGSLRIDGVAVCDIDGCAGGSGGVGANTALSNLSTTAINTSLNSSVGSNALYDQNNVSAGSGVSMLTLGSEGHINAGNASGTYIGINGTSSADFLNFQYENGSEFEVGSTGNVTAAGTLNVAGGNFAIDDSGDATIAGSTTIGGTIGTTGGLSTNLAVNGHKITGLASLTLTATSNTILDQNNVSAGSGVSMLTLGSEGQINAGNASGTYIGINGTSSADFLNFQYENGSEFEVGSTGNVTAAGTLNVAGGNFAIDDSGDATIAGSTTIGGTIGTTGGLSTNLAVNGHKITGLASLTLTATSNTILDQNNVSAGSGVSMLTLGSEGQINAGNASGTYIGINGTSSADFLNFQYENGSEFEVGSTGNVTAAGTLNVAGGNFAIDDSGDATIAGSTTIGGTIGTTGGLSTNLAVNGHKITGLASLTLTATSNTILDQNNVSAGSGVSMLTLGSEGQINAGNASGTYIGINGTSSADFLNFQYENGSEFEVGSTGNVTAAGTINAVGGYDDNGTAGKTLSCGTNDGIKSVTIAGGIITAATCTTNTLTDLAENYTSTQNLSAGDVVALDPTTYAGVLMSSSAYQSDVIGVVSTAPDITLGGDNPGYPIALSGRVPVNVSLENGPIEPGDYLTSSSIPGYAMNATQPGTVIGVALTGLSDADATTCPSGTGLCGTVNVFMETSYYNPTTAGDLQNGSAGSFGSLVVSGALSTSSLSVSGDATFGGDVTITGMTTVGDITIGGHIITTGNTPVIAPLLAAGTNATAKITGNDTSGTITITTGSVPMTGDLSTITFAKQFGATPRVLITPAGSASAPLAVYPDQVGTGSFTIGITNTPQPNTTYTFNYFAVQ